MMSDGTLDSARCLSCATDAVAVRRTSSAWGWSAAPAQSRRPAAWVSLWVSANGSPPTRSDSRLSILQPISSCQLAPISRFHARRSESRRLGCPLCACLARSVKPSRCCSATRRSCLLSRCCFRPLPALPLSHSLSLALSLPHFIPFLFPLPPSPLSLPADSDPFCCLHGTCPGSPSRVRSL